MPLHLAASNRREFLTRTAVGMAGLTLLKPMWGAEASHDPNCLALLSDTHIPETPDVEARGVNMTNNLRQVVTEVVASPAKPAGVVVNGDCAFLKGLKQDYANFSQCLTPFHKAELPVHLTLGNHDHRDVLYEVLTETKPAQPLVASRHVTVLATPHANWFLLDSLMATNVVTGDLGDAQRAWLATALDAHADKPAIVMAHHTPQFEPPAAGKPWGGLQDTAEFMQILQPRRHVKAFVFGHSHNWSTTEQDGLHLINLPPVAYVFGAGKPNGWVLANVGENGIRLELQTLNKEHPQHKQVVALTWRA